MYVDGNPIGTTETAVQATPKTGYLVLGQDQDTYGGGFTDADALGGVLSGVYWMDVALSGEEVTALYKGSADPEREHASHVILGWDEILDLPRNGDIQLIQRVDAGQLPSHTMFHDPS